MPRPTSTRRVAPPRRGGERALGALDVYASTRTSSAHMTPKTRTLYAFSDTPSQDSRSATDRLREINDTVSSGVAANALHLLSSASSADARSDGAVMASGYKRSRALLRCPLVPARQPVPVPPTTPSPPPSRPRSGSARSAARSKRFSARPQQSELGRVLHGIRW